jgi:uncharacterized membrane protein
VARAVAARLSGAVRLSRIVSLARSVRMALSAAVVVALALYPLLVYTALGRFGASGVAAVLAAVCLTRLIFARLFGGKALGGAYLEMVSAGGVLLAAASLWFDSTGAVRYYPVLVNAGLLLMFAASLVKPPTVIERIARLREPDLPPAAVRYTRLVTIAWTVFFVCNGAAAFYTAGFMSLEAWALYNGLIAYLLIAGVFAIELAFRTAMRARLKA